MFSVSQVMAVLTPWLGPSLCTLLYPDAERICVRFSGYSEKQPLSGVHAFIRDLLFDRVLYLTGGSLLVFPEEGAEAEMCREDFEVIADDILYLLLSGFPADPGHLILLEDYAREYGSLSALRKLYVSFGSLMSPEERATLHKVILGFPSFRLWWLRDPQPGGRPS